MAKAQGAAITDAAIRAEASICKIQQNDPSHVGEKLIGA